MRVVRLFPGRWPLVTLALSCLMLVPVAVPGHLAGAAQAAEAYRLGPSDVARVRIGRWNLERATFEAWDGLSGEYTVGADGMISFPVAGFIQAEGRSASEISADVARMLQINIGLAEAPAVALEIVTYAPVFVSGGVAKPGAYEYQPGMTVQQVLALAGGDLSNPLNGPRSDRDLIQAFGTRSRLLERQGRLMLRIARLEAEIRDESEIELPDELPPVAGVDQALALETTLMQANDRAFAAKQRSVAELIDLLEVQIDKLASQMTLVEEEIARTEEDLRAKEELLERGLARSSDPNAVASKLTNLQLRQIELLVERLNAEQELNAATRERTDIADERQIGLLSQLEEARSEVNALRIDIDTQSALFSEAYAAGANPADTTGLVELKITLSKRSEGPAVPEPAVMQTRLSPGDTVHVEAVTPAITTQ